MIPNMKGLIPSPYGPSVGGKPIPKALLEHIKKEMGVECVVLAVEVKKTNCNDVCLGHFSQIAGVGFSEHHLAGIGEALKQHGPQIIKESQELK